MLSSRLRVPLLSAAAATMVALVVVGAPTAIGAPSADDRGYLDSTARCTAPDVAVVFGSTQSSRVAICRQSDGKFEYRGARVRDGATLIVAATQSGAGEFVADNDGVTYTVTAKSLVVADGETVISDEPMLDFHGQQAAAPSGPPPPDTPTPTTPLPPPLAAEEGGSSS